MNRETDHIKPNKGVITDKAATLFFLRGIQAVSIDEIIAHCGISKRAFYQHFSSKEVLVEAVVERITNKGRKFLRLSPEISPNAITEIDNFFNYLQESILELSPAFLKDLKRHFPDAQSKFSRFWNLLIIPHLENNISRGIGESLYRADFDRELTGWYYCWQIINILERAKTSGGARRLIRLTQDFYLHGLVNQKGLALLLTKV